MYDISQLCLNSINENEIGCSVKREDQIVELQGFGIALLCLASLLGFVGDMATLLSVSYSAIKKLHEFDKNLKRITIFILNLSLGELFILTFRMIPSIFTLLMPQGRLRNVLCKIYPLLKRNSYTLESSAIALISVIRCIDLTLPGVWEKMTTKKRNLELLLFLPWLLWIISTLLIIFQQCFLTQMFIFPLETLSNGVL